jgi:N-acetylmuramoyl-L-alanine amidase
MQVILGTAHGINTPGKQSPDGKLKEYQWSREICQKVKEQLLNEGIVCVIDIEDDIEPSLSYRVNKVNKLCRAYEGDSIYVSIHINAADSDKQWHNANGWTIWVYNKASLKAKNLALTFFDIAKDYNIFGNRCIPSSKYYSANLYVLRKTICPAVLTENLFQDNEKDAEFLLSEEGKNTICDLHIKAIKQYLNKI